MGFEKAKREKVWIKALLTGPSGAGKSYSALRLATGIAKKCDSKIAYVGTEHSRDKYYANEFEYDLMQLESYSVSSYNDAIDEAIEGGYKVLILDSISPEWDWINDQHSKLQGNSFTNWSKIKPKHKLFMEKVLFSEIHIIACARGKTEWVLEEQNGKQVPKKVGMGATQDKDISFNYTVSFQLEQTTHNATADKDNTHLFDEIRTLTEKDGELLYEWANTGEAPAPKKTRPVIDIDKNEAIKDEISSLYSALDSNKRKELKAFMKKNGIDSLKDITEIPTESLQSLADFIGEAIKDKISSLYSALDSNKREELKALMKKNGIDSLKDITEIPTESLQSFANFIESA